jgi:4-amino-4-deoxy-L-arabinose transferase-like glycosyltransferase
VVVLFGDEVIYTVVSRWIVEYISGKPLSNYVLGVVSAPFGEYARNIYLYLVSLFYYLFGYSPVSIIFMNCIISVLTGIIYYSIAKQITNIIVAKITAILVTFFPSLIIWSIVNLKDSLFIFLTALILWLFLQLLKNNKIIYLILLILSIILQHYLRRWILLPTLIVLGLSYLIMKMRIRIIHIFLSFIILVSIFPTLKENLNEFKTRTINYHRGVISTGGNCYRIYDDWLYKPDTISATVNFFGLFKALSKGWLHFFLEPFPWKIFSKSSLLSFPQMIIWYFLLPFSAIGILTQLRYNWRKSFLLVLYFLIIGSIFSLTGGNIGTDFRMRDPLTPIILLFSSIGLIKILYFKQNISSVRQNQ